ncbi:MAG: flagellar biosynthesis protein FlhF [Campylobacterales bacterium]|nr:flagellar biosynthesis protein FlhF [Campylobacterales bacterium]
MTKETFTGETSAEALAKAKAKYGDDISIISSKEVIKKTPLRSGVFEVVVLVDETAIQRKIQPPKANEDVVLQLSEAVKQVSEITKLGGFEPTEEPVQQFSKPTTTQQPKRETPSIHQEDVSQLGVGDLPDIRNIKNAVTTLMDKVKLIQNTLWDNSSDNRDGIVIPPEFAEIFRITKESGMSNEHLNEIMTLTLKHMPLKMRDSSETIKNYFKVLLKRMTPIRTEFKLTKPNKKIYMLVGPTGVGKTTTLAKLAAKFAIKENYKVGIITLDTYRIGAVEHVMFYAKTMKLPIEQVSDPGDFAAAISSLKHCDYILIDTAGCSQHDGEKLAKLKSFLDAQNHTTIDVKLVLSSTTKLTDLREIYKNFSHLNIDSVIATKFDESSTFGNLFSLVYETKKPLSYFSVGQEVPDDIKPADGDYFVKCILEGFSKAE